MSNITLGDALKLKDPLLYANLGFERTSNPRHDSYLELVERARNHLANRAKKLEPSEDQTASTVDRVIRPYAAIEEQSRSLGENDHSSTALVPYQGEQNSEFSLEGIDVVIVDDPKSDPTVPEYEPYAPHAGDSVRYPEGLITSGLKAGFHTCSNILYWTVRSVSDYARQSLFGLTEYELLMSLKNPNLEVRATKSYTTFFNPANREQLYSLSNGIIRSVLIDPVISRLWYEGIRRSDQLNFLEILKSVPHILCEELKQNHEVISSEIDQEIRKAVAVLKDNEYSNIEYLREFEAGLIALTSSIEARLAKQLIKGTDNAEGAHETISKKLKEMRGELFPDLNSTFEQQRKISYLDMKRDQAFSFGGAIAIEAKTMRSRVRETASSITDNSVAAYKARIQFIAQELVDFNRLFSEVINRNESFVEEVQKTINTYQNNVDLK